MTQLSETQTIILSTAAERDGYRVLPTLPAIKKNKGAIASMLKGFLRRGFLTEEPADEGDEIWRTDPDNGRLVLVLSPAGFEAVNIELKAMPQQKRPVIKRTKLVSMPTAKADTKIGVLLDLLRRKEGMTINDAIAATGWQAHSVRGSMSGAIRKKFGFDVTSNQAERGRVYRIEPISDDEAA